MSGGALLLEGGAEWLTSFTRALSLSSHHNKGKEKGLV